MHGTWRYAENSVVIHLLKTNPFKVITNAYNILNPFTKNFFKKSETPRMLNLLKTILKQINSIYKSIPNNK